jgi:hypothetical protein
MVPRVGHEIKDENRSSGRALCKDIKLMKWDTQRRVTCEGAAS